MESLLIAYSFLYLRGPLPMAALPVVDQPVATGERTLTVSVTDQGMVTTVPPGSQRVPLLTLALTAGCDSDVPVASLTVRRTGLGAVEDVAAIYAVSDGVRYSRAQTISRRDGTVTLSLRRFTVPACQTRLVQVLVDFAAEAAIAGQHRLEPVPPGVFAPDTSIRVQNTVSPVTRQITPSGNQGRLTVQALNTPGGLRVGERRTLGAFRFTAEDRAQYVMKVTVTNDGNVHDDDITQLQLETGNQVVSNTVPKLDNDQATFVLDPPLLIPRNSQRIIQIQGTVIGGTGRSLHLIIEQPSDVVTAH